MSVSVYGPTNVHSMHSYRVNPKRPARFIRMGTNTNYESWKVMEAMFKLSRVIDYWDLCVACRHHVHGDKACKGKGPVPWINYCIKSGWLVRA